MNDSSRRSYMEPGYLAWHPEVGIAFGIVGAIVFLFLLYQVLANGPLIQWDENLSRQMNQLATNGAPWLMPVSHVGSLIGYWGNMAIIVAVGIFWIAQKAWRPLSMLLFGVVGGEVIFSILAGVINRPRPSVVNPMEGLLKASFPSGHTLSAILLFGLLMYIYVPRLSSAAARALVLIGGTIMILWISIGRLFLGSHYPTDVIAGVGLALAIGGPVYTAVERYWLRRNATVPVESSPRPR